MTNTDRIEAAYMFGLLDCQTWNLARGDKWIGQLHINHADRWAQLALDDWDQDGPELAEIKGYVSALKWVRTHLRGGPSR